MSRTINHMDIVMCAQMEQWEKMHTIEADINQMHIRQAFYMLCKQGNANAVEQIAHHFQNDDGFVCECIAGGMEHSITLDTLKILRPLLQSIPITDPDVLQAALRNQNPQADEMLEYIVPWYDPDFLRQHCMVILTMVLKKVGDKKTRGFFAIMERIGLSNSNIDISTRAVNCTLEHLVISDQQRLMQMIGEENLKLVAQRLQHKKFTTDIIEAYCAVEQRKRMVGAIDLSHCSRTRKI